VPGLRGGPVARRQYRRRVSDPATAPLEGVPEPPRARRPGTAASALSHRDYRIVFGGTFLSNIGTWMQNVLLGAFGWEISHSTSFVGLLYWCQLGPALVLSPLGGLLADALDRRRLLLTGQVQQLTFSILLAVLASADDPSRLGLAVCVLALGLGNAVVGPAMGSTPLQLVPPADLRGAVALQSISMNLTRVIGPAIGAVVYSQVGPGAVFGINAGTYGFAIAALLIARLPRRPTVGAPALGVRQLLSGFAILRTNLVARRVLLTIATFSLTSLTFLGLMPALADEHLGIRPRSAGYGLLYAVFGIGAACGAVLVGSVLADRSPALLVRRGLLAFSVLLAWFGSTRSSAIAFPVVFVFGFAYFTAITALSTLLQTSIADDVRGRMVALWTMCFGGMVPLGTLVGGWVADHWGITAVMLYGAVAAFVLALVVDLDGRLAGAAAPVRPPGAPAPP
jgi:predicted MFS family arabinose efflux permease